MGRKSALRHMRQPKEVSCGRCKRWVKTCRERMKSASEGRMSGRKSSTRSTTERTIEKKAVEIVTTAKEVAAEIVETRAVIVGMTAIVEIETETKTRAAIEDVAMIVIETAGGLDLDRDPIAKRK